MADSSGTVLFSVHGQRTNVYSPLQAELLAIRFGLEIALGKGYTKIIIETDSLLAVKEIEKGYASLCEWGNIVCDISFYLAQCESGRVCHVYRKANSLAHHLAQMSV